MRWRLGAWQAASVWPALPRVRPEPLQVAKALDGSWAACANPHLPASCPRRHPTQALQRDFDLRLGGFRRSGTHPGPDDCPARQRSPTSIRGMPPPARSTAPPPLPQALQPPRRRPRSAPLRRSRCGSGASDRQLWRPRAARRGSGRRELLDRHLFEGTTNRSQPDSCSDLARGELGELQHRLCRGGDRGISVPPLHADSYGKREPSDTAAHYRSSPSKAPSRLVIDCETSADLRTGYSAPSGSV